MVPHEFLPYLIAIDGRFPGNPSPVPVLPPLYSIRKGGKVVMSQLEIWPSSLYVLSGTSPHFSLEYMSTL